MSQEHYERMAEKILKSYGADTKIENIQNLREYLVTEYNNGFQMGFDACGDQIKGLLGMG